MNIPTLSKTMLVTMKTIENPGSVSEKGREKNKQAACVDSDAIYDECSAIADAAVGLAAYADAYADAYAAYWAADAAACAAEYVHLGNYEKAQKWVNKYFELTGENKQDYIDYIKKESP